MENWTEAGRHCFPREAGSLEDDDDDVLLGTVVPLDMQSHSWARLSSLGNILEAH